MDAGLPVLGSRQDVFKIQVRQATLLSFLDTFRLLSFIAMICIPLVLLFKRVRTRPTPAVVD